MICSISVVPERGMPTTKIGTVDGSPLPNFDSISRAKMVFSMR